MAIYKEPFGVVLATEYKVNETINSEGISEIMEDLGDVGLYREFGRSQQLSLFGDNSEPKTKHYGGKFDWKIVPLNNQPFEEKPEIKIQLMRLWTVQMVQQLVRNKSYVNEIDSKIKVDITERDLESTLNVLDKVTNSIHNEMELDNNRMVRKKKNTKFKFSHNET
jgi:hypothetical protein